MRIKSSGYIEIIALLWLLVILWPILFYGQLWIVFAICLIWCAIVFLCWMWLGRLVVFTEKGCSIKFLWWKKECLWEELHTARYFKFSRPNGYLLTYTSGAVFSLRTNNTNVSPFSLYSFFHPFSFVFVCFTPTKRCPKHDLKVYEIDESFFRNQINKWGITMQ